MTYQEWRLETQKAIDAAWDTTDPDTIAFQNQHFPEGKPSVDLFLKRMTAYARLKCRENTTLK